MEEHPHESIDIVFNCVIPYIHNGDDRNSISLVCRNWYEIDCLTRKHVTVHVCYSCQPSRVAQRFPYLESLTLKGSPRVFSKLQYIDLTLWIKEIVYSFKCLKSLDIRRLILSDSDLEQIARRRGKDLRVLKINSCEGFEDFIHIGRYCNDLRTLCLEDNQENQNNWGWLHELALNNTRIESFKFSSMISEYDVKDLTLLAKSCSQSLVYLKMGKCCLSDLRDVFSHAVNLKDFACCELINAKRDEYAGLKFPPNMRISIDRNYRTDHVVLPLSNQLSVLNIKHLNEASQCSLIRRCPNLETLYIYDVFMGDNVLQAIGQSCKKLRKLKTAGKAVTLVGLIALAQGCLELECLHIDSSYQHISNEYLECIGRCFKNLNDIQIILDCVYDRRISVRHSGIRAMLIGCSKLERLRINRQLTYKSLINIGEYGHNLKYLSVDIIKSSDARLVDSGIRAIVIGCSKLESLRLDVCCRGLKNVGLEYIGKYGHNLRHLSLGGHYVRDSEKKLIELSKCPRLRKLEIHDCYFSKQLLSTLMFNSESLRCLWVLDRDENIVLAKTRYKCVVDRNYKRNFLAKTGRF